MGSGEGLNNMEWLFEPIDFNIVTLAINNCFVIFVWEAIKRAREVI